MTIAQFVLYAILALVAMIYIRRVLLARSIKHYSSVDVAELMNAPGRILLLDVRTQAEHDRQSIRGSMHIPAHQLKARLGELEKHKHKEIICYCATGARSLSAAATLKKLGFATANLKNGIAGWNAGRLKS